MSSKNLSAKDLKGIAVSQVSQYLKDVVNKGERQAKRALYRRMYYHTKIKGRTGIAVPYPPPKELTQIAKREKNNIDRNIKEGRTEVEISKLIANRIWPKIKNEYQKLQVEKAQKIRKKIIEELPDEGVTVIRPPDIGMVEYANLPIWELSNILRTLGTKNTYFHNEIIDLESAKIEAKLLLSRFNSDRDRKSDASFDYAIFKGVLRIVLDELAEKYYNY